MRKRAWQSCWLYSLCGFSPTQAGPVVNSSLINCTLGQVIQKAWSCDSESLHLCLFNSVYSKEGVRDMGGKKK